MAELKNIIITGSRTSDYEKVEITLSFDLYEGDKAVKVHEQASKVLDALLDKEYTKMVERQRTMKVAIAEAKQKAKEEEERILESLPKTVDEANQVVYNNKKLEDIPTKELKELVSHGAKTPEGKGAMLILNISVPDTTKTSNDELTSEEKNKFIPAFVKGSKGVTYQNATKSQLEFIVKANKGTPEEKEIARKMLLKK